MLQRVHPFEKNEKIKGRERSRVKMCANQRKSISTIDTPHHHWHQHNSDAQQHNILTKKF
jgi:hypothetical protein